MDKIELKRRTRKFAVEVTKFIEKQPSGRALNVLCNQLIRTTSSVGANYRSAYRGKSSADLINKIIIVEEEADESLYWLELMEESNLVRAEDLIALKKEADELTAIFTAIGKTAKTNQQNNKSKKS